ncbi:transposase, partial [Escherichia coli]|nr:transposase [Escherichia coli]
AAFTRSKQRYGAPRLTDELRAQGYPFYDLFFLDRMPYSMAGYKHWLLTESMYCNVYIFNYL